MAKPKKVVQPSAKSIQQIDQLQAELNPSVHYDYTEQIKDVLANHNLHCKEIGRPVYMRQYMWDLFAVSVIMQINDKIVNSRTDYPNDMYTDKDADELIVMARDTLSNIIEGKRDYKLISEEYEDISTYEYTNTQKLLALIKAAYISSIAYNKLRDYEKLFVVQTDDV